MKTARLIACIILLLVTTFSLAGPKPLHITLVQLNDVYELMPIKTKNNSEGGLARVSTVIKRLKDENPLTYSVLAGDFLSPSALGLAPVTVDGQTQPLAGKQMVATFNKLGLDYVAIGNHELDLKEEQLLARMGESKFTWLSSNVFWVSSTGQKPFPGVVPGVVFEVKAKGRSAKVGLFSVTIDSTQKPYVAYNTDVVGVARAQVKSLQDQGADIIVALTHLDLASDILLAESVPGLDLILGGHEHENVNIQRGPTMVPILKADANARTIYIHNLFWHPENKHLSIQSELQWVTDEIPEDPEVQAEVKRWQDLAFDAFRKQGFDPEAKVTISGEELDGREASVRNRSTRLTQIMADSMSQAFGGKPALYNAGSIRIDDEIDVGQVISNYDILRVIPFGGQVSLFELSGADLDMILSEGLNNKGTGGFLQTAGIEGKPREWMIEGKPLDMVARYQVVLNDYLASGKEKGLEFVGTNAKPVSGTQSLDWRVCFSKELQRIYPPTGAP